MGISSTDSSTPQLVTDAALPPDAPVASVFQHELRQRVVAITQAIFPGAIATEMSSDPDSPAESWEVFTVHAPDDENLMPKKNQWHRQVLADLGDEAWRFTLCVYPVPT